MSRPSGPLSFRDRVSLWVEMMVCSTSKEGQPSPPRALSSWAATVAMLTVRPWACLAILQRMPSSYLISGCENGDTVRTCDTAALRLDFSVRIFCAELALQFFKAVAACRSCSIVALSWGL